VSEKSRTLNEYPAASYMSLREAVAGRTGLDPDYVAPGAGADELILLAGRAFLAPGQTSVAAVPTYPLYGIATAQVRGKLIPIEAPAPGFGFPADEVIAAARQAEVVWLCVPSNPIGNRPTDDDIASVIAATDGVVVLDAAYAEFSGDDWPPWVDRYHNLLVLHTLSKAYGLAGTRVGYGLGHPDLIAALDAVRPPGSIASLSIELAVSALNAPHRMQSTVAALAEERNCLAERLAALGLRVLPSQTNFLLCEVGSRAREVAASLMTEGLVARTFPSESPLGSYLRFTVRTRGAHDRLLSALQRSLP
jgi:histidinol-phosphate aminotransferase